MELASLAIVGGGSVAVSFLAQLIEQLRFSSRTHHVSSILLFEPAKTVGAGDAYASDLNTNLLNIPVRNMSAYAENKAHFSEWLRNLPPSTLEEFQVTNWNDDSFLPRPLFGKYLEEVFHNVLRTADDFGITIRHIRARVDAVRQQLPSGWRISTAEQEYPANFVVLCNGNMPSATFPELNGLPNFFRNPYPVRQLVESIGRHEAVAVIGTSLSAVDAVVALKEAGHHAPLIAVSRNGRLPSVRSVKNRRNLQRRLDAPQLRALATASGGTLTLEQVVGLLLEQLGSMGQAADLRDILGEEGSAAEQLDREVIASSAHERLWQVVASATNDVVDVIWNLLDDAERHRFRRDWRSLWMARRATFPMENAVKLQRYLRTGNFEIRPGFHSCVYDEDAGVYRLCLRSGGRHDVLSVRHVIDATSFSLDVSTSEDPLIRQLLDSGTACADPHGGIALDYDTGCLLDARGQVQKTISLLGSLAVGTYFWTLSMDVNARLALDQARRLATALSGCVAEPACLTDAPN